MNVPANPHAADAAPPPREPDSVVPAAGNGNDPSSAPGWLTTVLESRWGLVVVLIATTLIYARSLAADFAWDDWVLLVPNDAYTTFDLDRLVFGMGNSVEYLPVRDLTPGQRRPQSPAQFVGARAWPVARGPVRQPRSAPTRLAGQTKLGQGLPYSPAQFVGVARGRLPCERRPSTLGTHPSRRVDETAPT